MLFVSVDSTSCFTAIFKKIIGQISWKSITDLIQKEKMLVEVRGGLEIASTNQKFQTTIKKFKGCFKKEISGNFAPKRCFDLSFSIRD